MFWGSLLTSYIAITLCNELFYIMVGAVKGSIVVTHLSLGPSDSLEVRGLLFLQRCWWILSLKACDAVSTGKWRFGGACFPLSSVQQSKEVDCPTQKMEVARSYETSSTTYSLHGSHNQAGLTLQSGGASWKCCLKVSSCSKLRAFVLY